MSKQLEDSVHEQIKVLSAHGDTLVKQEKFEEAKAKYIAALKLLPTHPTEWEAATWLYAAIGDVHFKQRNFEKVLRCFVNAVQCPGGLGNPFVHLRLGQASYEQGDLEKAADELTRAYMGAGIDIFMDDDPKYLAFLETKIEI